MTHKLDIIIANSFSINMLDGYTTHFCSSFTRLSQVEAAKLAKNAKKSIVGHKDTASVFSSVLGVNVAFNRETYILDGVETLLIGQYKGPRLEAGATSLPEGAKINWWLMGIIKYTV